MKIRPSITTLFGKIKQTILHHYDNSRQCTEMSQKNKIWRPRCPIVGDTTVGKSSIVQMFLTDGRQFPKNYNMTRGVDLRVKSLNIPDSTDNVELYLYDASGKNIYKGCIARYWRSPDMFMAVYDVTSKASFDSVTEWISLVQNSIPSSGDSKTIPGVLFANKTDLVERRVIMPKTGASMAEKLGLYYYEGSAKDSKGIEEPFFLLVHEWHKYVNERQSFVLNEP